MAYMKSGDTMVPDAANIRLALTGPTKAVPAN